MNKEGIFFSLIRLPMKRPQAHCLLNGWKNLLRSGRKGKCTLAIYIQCYSGDSTQGNKYKNITRQSK
jgi:hypothetical protein